MYLDYNPWYVAALGSAAIIWHPEGEAVITDKISLSLYHQVQRQCCSADNNNDNASKVLPVRPLYNNYQLSKAYLPHSSSLHCDWLI